jgi:16S rRNA C1402 N4-methylase RsmH
LTSLSEGLIFFKITFNFDVSSIFGSLDKVGSILELSKLPNIEDTSKLKVILKKIKPSDKEVKINPGSRSAILRAAEKIK